jgi:hypothetical protein
VNNQLIVSSASVATTPITPAVEQTKLALLAESKLVVSCRNMDEQTVAVHSAREIKRLVSEVEKTRKAVKEPVITIGKRIDELARTFCLPLETELSRVNALVTTFQLAEQRRVQAEFEEQQRQAAKAQADIKAAAELAAGASTVQDEIAAHNLTEEAEANLDVAVAAPQPEAARAAGLVVRTTIEFEITDAKALYAAMPNFFELTPRRSIIRDTITENTKLPGLRVWKETKSNVRT